MPAFDYLYTTVLLLKHMCDADACSVAQATAIQVDLALRHH